MLRARAAWPSRGVCVMVAMARQNPELGGQAPDPASALMETSQMEVGTVGQGSDRAGNWKVWAQDLVDQS